MTLKREESLLKKIRGLEEQIESTEKEKEANALRKKEVSIRTLRVHVNEGYAAWLREHAGGDSGLDQQRAPVRYWS